MNNEDIKVLEKYINGKDMMKETLVQAIENLIVGYKELEKENKTLKGFTSSIFNDTLEKDYIPKSKVREKIEELEKQMEKDEVDDFGIHSIGWSALDYIVDYLKSILQEGDDK